MHRHHYKITAAAFESECKEFKGFKPNSPGEPSQILVTQTKI